MIKNWKVLWSKCKSQSTSHQCLVFGNNDMYTCTATTNTPPSIVESATHKQTCVYLYATSSKSTFGFTDVNLIVLEKRTIIRCVLTWLEYDTCVYASSQILMFHTKVFIELQTQFGCWRSRTRLALCKFGYLVLLIEIDLQLHLSGLPSSITCHGTTKYRNGYPVNTLLLTAYQGPSISSVSMLQTVF